MNLDYEMQRMREWRHDTDKVLWAQNALLRQLTEDVAAIKPTVESMARSEDIAVEVARRLRNAHKITLTRWQRIAAFALAAIPAMDIASHWFWGR